MNPYVTLGSGIGTTEAASLSVRLTAWHDAMVAHERRLRSGRAGDICDEECPHVEARALWTEALATFGERASELTFLHSRATVAASPFEEPIEPTTGVSEPVDAAHGSSRLVLNPRRRASSVIDSLNRSRTAPAEL